MGEYRQTKTYQDLAGNLRTFIELSLQEETNTWSEWVRSSAQKLQTRCWERKHCDEKMCPAYENECGRCWLIAGTMCDGRVQGKFAQKYSSCMECEVFREAVFKDAFTELQELTFILTHSLVSRQTELREALDNVKTLSGLLPICCSCKKIRDDHGYWRQIEQYIGERSETRFSHGICPECAERMYKF